MNISLLGSTGSIGRQSLQVIKELGFRIVALTAGKNVRLMEEQCREFTPEYAAMSDEGAACELRTALRDTDIKVLSGEEALCELAALEQAHCVIGAIMGIAALRPVLAAVRAGKRVALANKECLVCAGDIIMSEAERCSAQIIPVDSEHSAIFQCLQACGDFSQVKRLLLTCSGGPFYGMSRQQLSAVTAEMALRHPNWSMGRKITIDSATLMNKGLEFIEAMRLYSAAPEQIEVLIHRQSIIHSMVEYCDNGILAQLGSPDMRLPIQYALTYPRRAECGAKALDFGELSSLSFAKPNLSDFPCLKIAMDTALRGQIACTVMNAANELAVERFLKGETTFYGISDFISKQLEQAALNVQPTLENILSADSQVRKEQK